MIKNLEHGLYAVQGTILTVSDEYFFDISQRLERGEKDGDVVDAMQLLRRVSRAMGPSLPSLLETPNFSGSSYSVKDGAECVFIWGQVKELGRRIDNPFTFMRSLGLVGGLFSGSKFIRGDGSSFGIWQKAANQFIVYLGDDD